ncbi:hypothetical protein EM4838_14150 [Enterococcus mundtii]|uniref:Uncharacterized protein n=1 Tax=Enterococcus mundtii TaxID=53346 RepID=A0ABQ0VF21_ENTMU|nr:hypothetical protein EM4838_14150 [Enterococcus mundtii]RYT02614.1 hypothetical protein EAI87_11615 [Enterococcus mundtii]GEL81206.1 hypothetical protein EMU01_23500 [Enterococcus mundtii]GEN19313.1 hypothetical protein LAC02_25940 [Ligilactobacillus acidipiscis]
MMSLPDKQAEVCEIFCGFQLFERAFINASYLFLVQKMGAPFGLLCENELVGLKNEVILSESKRIFMPIDSMNNLSYIMSYVVHGY